MKGKNKLNYTEKMLAHVAKRENNQKRSYLVVDPLQGKHIPVSGRAALNMFDKLAEKVRLAYLQDCCDPILLVGFAETATAIGARLAVSLESLYMQTTREPLKNADYLFFTESHSHATEQKLCKNDVDNIITKVSRIVFVEDEVTTGNTIMKIIDIIEKMYPGRVKFAVASILNGMDEASLKRYAERDIDIHYLVKTHHDTYSEIAERYPENGTYIEKDTSKTEYRVKNVINGYINTRRLCRGDEYNLACRQLADTIAADIGNAESVLVLGTEEFMYPAIFTASVLEEKCFSVRTHSTTRSPIAVCSESEYPLHVRFELASLYDAERRTFIYDLKKYDRVVVLTDAQPICDEGIFSLVNTLRSVGNDNITIYRWLGSDYLVKTSYLPDDVTLLLKDVTGLVQPQPTEERERLIQSGKHYCEMLPIEYVPTQKYMQVYEEALKTYAKPTALAVGRLSDIIIKEKGKDVVLVSLARAGIPIGILIKRYIRLKYKLDVPHYSISIIRGRGIDRCALDYIIEKHGAKRILFVDGWIGKGAILGELKKELADYPEVSSDIAVIADPANVTELCGTHDDILIPSSCLNSTISGLVSRTFLRSDIIKDSDFHGAVYYGELKVNDLSYEFINAIEECFELECGKTSPASDGQGIDEVREIAEHFGISDINLVKPGIGEATRVLLRRVPWKILIDERYKDSDDLAHLIRLANEKNVPIEYYPLSHYKTCGIIKKIADA